MVTLMQTVDTSHEDMIHDAQIDFYGVRLATCSSDRSVKIFDVSNGIHKLVANLSGHEGPVWQVAWAHPMFGDVLASCGYDRKVIFWKRTTGDKWETTYVYDDHDSSVNSVCWAPHEFGLILACGSSDGAVSVITSSPDGQFSAKKIHNAHTIGCNAVSWEPTISPGITSEPGQNKGVMRFATGGCDNLVKIWKYDETKEQWAEEEKLEAHSDWVRDVAWAPSIGLAQSMIASCSQDRRVIVWTRNSESKWSSQIVHTFEDVIWHVSWSITGNILAVSGGDNKVSLWKETDADKMWVCISDVNKGQGQQQQQPATVTEAS